MPCNCATARNMIEKTSDFQHSMQKTSYFQHTMPRKPDPKTRENQFENFRAYRLEMNVVLKTRHIMAKRNYKLHLLLLSHDKPSTRQQFL